MTVEKRLEKLERVFARRVEIFNESQASETLTQREIGRVTCLLLLNHETVSVPDLTQHLEHLVEDSESARGEIAVELDLERAVWEAAIKTLNSLHN